MSALAVLCLLTAATLALGYANKARCTGPEFNEWGRSGPDYQSRSYRDVCYSDVQNLWVGRDIDKHVFPYVHGGIDPDGSLWGGVVEYPVLTGVLIWAGALLVTTDAGFLLSSALLMAPFGLAVAWWLGRLSRWRALLWAIGPPVVLYAFHNWDLPVVASAVAAVFVMHRWREPLARRSTVAAVLLGLGFALKLYPAIFVLPLMLHVFTEGGKDWRGALRVAGAAAGTGLLVNVPFALAGFQGWAASFEFQSRRQVDLSTNSVWYWGFRHWTGDEGFQAAMDIVSPGLMLVSFALACWIGWLRYERTGTYPWVQVSAAMLCGFLLLHKVHSPQYTLWLLPFFVLVQVRWGWIAAYLLADFAMCTGIFRWLYLNNEGSPSGIHDGFTAQAVMIGVWGRAALLVGLFAAFLAARTTIHREDPVPEVAVAPSPTPATHGSSR